VTSSQVFALRPTASGSYRGEWARERRADSFWPVPVAFLVAGALLAAGTVYAPGLGLKAVLPAGPPVASGEAASLLGIIASATLTFLGVVFTLTLVALLVLAGGRGHEPESRGLAIAVILVAISPLLFVAYVASTLRLLQVAWVHYPPAGAYQLSRAPRLDGTS